MEFETEVEDIIQRTYNVKSFRFRRPPDLDYKPGQFLFITIKSGGEEMQKHFTISSSPTEGYLEFTKKLTGHPFSNALDRLEVGDWAFIRTPFGSFTFEGEHPRVAMLSGGIGITPLRSMCRYATDKRLDTSIVLIYGNRTEEDIVFRDELDAMQRENQNLRVIHTLSSPGESWKGYRGRIERELVEREIPDYLERVFYICGPPRLVEAMRDIAQELGVPEIILESFPGY